MLFRKVLSASHSCSLPLSVLQVDVTDYNDNVPLFESESVHVSIADNSRAGSFVVKVTASDPDVNDTLVYSLQPVFKNNNDYRCFRIDADSGSISYQPTAARSRTCNANRANYTLDVVASDGVNKALTRVTVLMMPTNRHAPKFRSNLYRGFVTENQPAGTHVIAVSAYDPDRGSYGQLRYMIQSEEHGWLFAIDPLSGNITTKRPLDREAQASYEFLVTVQDSGMRLDHAVVQIHVNDVNDNEPAFRQDVYRMNLIVSEIAIFKELFTVSSPGKEIISIILLPDEVQVG